MEGQQCERLTVWETDCAVTVQIKKLRDGSVGTPEEEKHNKLYFEWLSGCSKKGVAAVGKEVRMLLLGRVQGN